MAALKKYLLLTTSCWLVATSLWSEDFNLPNEASSHLPRISYEDFTLEEKDYLNALWVYEDVNNSCGELAGKCQFYLSSTYTTEGAAGQVLDNLVNGTIVRARKKYNELMETMIDQNHELLTKVIHLKSLINEHTANEGDDSPAVNNGRNLDINALNRQIEDAFKSQYDANVLKLFHNALIRIYQYAGIDVVTEPDDNDMRAYMRALIGAEAAIVSIRIKRGFTAFQAQTLKKYVEALRIQNPKAQIYLFGHAGDIRIQPNSITQTQPNKEVAEQNAQTGGLFASGSLFMGVDGGVISFSMTYDGFEALQRRAKAPGTARRSWTAPIRFNQNVVYKVPVDGVGKCKFNQRLVAAAGVYGASERGEKIVPAIKFETKCKSEEKDANGDCQTSYMGCTYNGSKYMNEVQEALLRRKMDEELDRMSKEKDLSLQLKEAFFNKILSDADALRDADLPYETKAEITRLREDECFTVLNERIGFSLGAFGFSIGFDGGSDAEIRCIEKFRDVLHMIRVPIPVHVAAESSFVDVINHNFEYHFAGYESLIRDVSFKNEACVILTSEIGAPDVLMGEKCDGENSAKSSVRNNLEGNAGDGSLKRLSDILNTDGNG